MLIDVNRLLFEYVGATALNTATEEELLTYIKSIAVKGTHEEVYRMKFFRLSQMDSETVTQYVTCPRSQAILCQFKIACTNHEQQTFVNFADEMITQQLILGLRNQYHQLCILSEGSVLPTLREKFQHLQCLESTEQSTNIMRSSMPPSGSVNAPIRSSYKRGRTQYQQTSYNTHPCKGCSCTSHESKTMARRDIPRSANIVESVA